MQNLRRFSIAFILAGLFLFSSATFAGAASLPQAAPDGGQIFAQKCIGCHSIGEGRKVGPDLKDVTQRRDPNWIRTFLSNPAKLIASGDATATQLLKENNNVTMPTLGLTDAEISSLITYLEKPGPLPPAAPQPAAPAGDPAQGRRLFSGGTPLTNGGVNCIACHTVAGVGGLNGGSLGPDLTHVFARYGGLDGMRSTLSTLPFPTMQGIFAKKPLTPAEQADLLAFFQQSDRQNPAPKANNVTPWFIGIGMVGMIILFGFLLAFWPRQRMSVSEQLRQKA